MADDDEGAAIIPIEEGKRRQQKPVATLAAGNTPSDWPDTLPKPGTQAYRTWSEGPSPDRKDPSWKYWMQARRAAQVIAGSVQGRPVGRKTTRKPLLTPEEIKDAALAMAAGKVAEDMLRASHMVAPHKAAAIAKTIEMLDSNDTREVQFAIKTILEYGDGKPSQTIINEGGDKPLVIRYETGVLSTLPPFVPGAGIESPGDALALAERDDDDSP